MSDRLLDQLLRVVGLVVWAVIGAPTWTALGAAPHPVVWTALYLVFAVLFVAATRPGLPLRSRRALVATEAAVGAALAVIGMPHFEGALLAIVAAQIPALASPLAALAWQLAQAAVLFPIILPSHGALGAAKATGEYAAFALFALVVVTLREREAAARRELARAHSLLLGTQALLAEDVRAVERAHVAREVHDAIGHGLSAAAIHLQLAARAHTGDPAITAASEAVRTTLADVRTLVGTMREATIQLGTAVRAMCAGIQEPKIHVAIESSLRIASAGVAHDVFRCVQEALTNSLRHARANAIWIEIGDNEQGVTATVRDDGIGARALQFGNGLDGMRARLAERGGTLEIETAPSQGTSLRAWVPR